LGEKGKRKKRRGRRKAEFRKAEKFKLEKRKTNHEETDPEVIEVELDQWKTGWLRKSKDLGTDQFESEIEKRFRKRLRLSFHEEETILLESSTNHPVDTTPEEEKFS
jgi:hypothetical protein